MDEENSVIRFKKAINYSILALVFDSLLSFIVVVFIQVALSRNFNYKSGIPIRISHLVKSIFHLTSLFYIMSFYYLLKIKALKLKITKFSIALLALVLFSLFSDLIIFSLKILSFKSFYYFPKINLIFWDTFYLLGLIFLYLIFNYSKFKWHKNLSAILIVLYSGAFVFYRLPSLFLNQIYRLNIFPFLNLISFFLAIIVLLCTLILLFSLKGKINVDFLDSIT